MKRINNMAIVNMVNQGGGYSMQRDKDAKGYPQHKWRSRGGRERMGSRSGSECIVGSNLILVRAIPVDWWLSGVPDKLEAPEIPPSLSSRNDRGPHYGVQSVVPVPAGGVQTAATATGALSENTHGAASRARHGQRLGCVGLGSGGIVGARHGRDGPRVVQLVARVAIFVFGQARDDDGKLEDSSVRAEPKRMKGGGWSGTYSTRGYSARNPTLSGSVGTVPKTAKLKRPPTAVSFFKKTARQRGGWEGGERAMCILSNNQPVVAKDVGISLLEARVQLGGERALGGIVARDTSHQMLDNAIAVGGPVLQAGWTSFVFTIGIV